MLTTFWQLSTGATYRKMKLERIRMDSDWQRFGLFVSDRRKYAEPMATPGAIHYLDQMNDTLYEYRYEQRGGTYTMRRWHNGTERSFSGPTFNMPEWLRAILDTARVAGAIKPIKEPPPEIILWFRTDADHNLIEFIEMT